MTSTPSKPRSPAGRRIRRFSATICSKACSRAPASPPMSRSSRNSRPATTSAPFAITVGRAATGNCCPGSSVARGASGRERATSAIPAVGRWKMLDNLRRTLSAPAAVLALLAGWTLPFHAALIWTLFVVLTIVLPTLIPVIAAIPPRRPGVTIVKPCARARRRFPSRLDALDADRRVPGGSGVAHGRCDRPHALALGRDPAPSARMGSGGAGDARSAPRPHGLDAPNGGGDRYWRRRSDRRFGVRPRIVAAWRFRSPRCGSPRRPSRAASVCLLERPLNCRCPTPTPRRSGEPRAAPGGSSRPSSRRPTTCCRPTIFRTIRRRRSRIGRRRPISASISFPSSARAISAGSEPTGRSIGSRRRSRR